MRAIEARGEGTRHLPSLSDQQLCFALMEPRDTHEAAQVVVPELNTESWMSSDSILHMLSR